MINKGNAIKYGDNVDTDVIIPARYLNTSDPKELAVHCGSSREHAPIAIKASGISLVIAKSFARIFYRNAINIGLAIIECPEAVDRISDGDEVEVDLDTGVITDKTTGETFSTEPFPEFIQNLIANGGLVESIKKGVIK